MTCSASTRSRGSHDTAQLQGQAREVMQAQPNYDAQRTGGNKGARARAQVKRDSFAHYFSQQKEQNEVTWTPTPLEALLDVDQVIEAWRLRGITIHRARPARAAGGLHKKQAANANVVQLRGAGCMPVAAFAAGPDRHVTSAAVLVQCAMLH